MDRSSGISSLARHVQPNIPSDPSALPIFHEAVLSASKLDPEKRYDYLRNLLASVPALSVDPTDALADLGMMISVLSADESVRMTDALVFEFQALSSEQTADQRIDNAKKLALAILSAAELHDASTMTATIVSLGPLNRALGTDCLAKILIEEVFDHLPDADPAIACQRIILASKLVENLPSELTQNYLEILATHIPADAARLSAALPALLDVISFVPATVERQNLFVRLTQQLYQSRMADLASQ